MVEKTSNANGKKFGIVSVSDSSGTEEIFVFNPNWEDFKEIKVLSLIECKIIKSKSASRTNFRLLGWKVINEK